MKAMRCSPWWSTMHESVRARVEEFRPQYQLIYFGRRYEFIADVWAWLSDVV